MEDKKKESKLQDLTKIKKDNIKEKALLLGNDEVIAKAIQNLLRKDSLN